MGTRRQRALAREGISAADVVGIARTNAGLMLATNVVLTAAGERGLVDKAELATRISPWLEATVSAWVALAQESWQESRLTTPQPRADLETLAAGSQLHQVLREITRDGSGWASPALISSRTDLAATVRDLVQAATGAADMAERYTRLPGESAAADSLTMPARHLAELENRCGCRELHPRYTTRRYSLIKPPAAACLRTRYCSRLTGSGSGFSGAAACRER